MAKKRRKARRKARSCPASGYKMVTKRNCGPRNNKTCKVPKPCR